MVIERTLPIIKPYAVAKNLIGEIYSRFESNRLRIIAVRMMRLSQIDTEELYKVHHAHLFFNGLVKFMTSGAVYLFWIEG